MRASILIASLVSLAGAGVATAGPPGHGRGWGPGQYREVEKRVTVPGQYRTEHRRGWFDPVYGDHGRRGAVGGRRWHAGPGAQGDHFRGSGLRGPRGPGRRGFHGKRGLPGPGGPCFKGRRGPHLSLQIGNGNLAFGVGLGGGRSCGPRYETVERRVFVQPRRWAVVEQRVRTKPGYWRSAPLHHPPRHRRGPAYSCGTGYRDY